MADSPSPDAENPTEGLDPDRGPWRDRLAAIVSMMRAMSRQDDPQAMVRDYQRRVGRLMPADRLLSISRRGLTPPRVRITRFSGWTQEVNPWLEIAKLPIVEGGLLAELIYAGEPCILDDLPAHVLPGDPARPYLEGMGSAIVLPNYDGGEALNITLLMRAAPAAFDRETLPERVWMSNLFGQAVSNRVLSHQLRHAQAEAERELGVVADIQRSLLPQVLPAIPRLDLAVHYQTARWAGGDAYDLFPLADGRWGILISDVSGHGTPAAVLMAITHAIAHGDGAPPADAGAFLSHLNNRLARRYTADGSMFVTAFYGVFDPPSRSLTYALAGHEPPRLKRCADGSVLALDAASDLPLGLDPDLVYEPATLKLVPGDQIVMYTDGITEALGSNGKLFGTARLDAAIATCHLDAEGLVASILDAVDAFTGGEPATDDRTLVVAKVS